MPCRIVVMTEQILTQGEPKRNSVSSHVVNVFASCRDTTPEKTCNLEDVLETLRTDEFGITQLREVLRSEGKEAYTERKKNLPAFTPICGTFEQRAKDKLTQHNGNVHHDLDKLTQARSASIKETLASDPYIAYCFFSPSWGLNRTYSSRSSIVHRAIWRDELSVWEAVGGGAAPYPRCLLGLESRSGG